MANTYDTGRLNLPFVGISTFGKSPYQPDWAAIDADVAVLGAPFDFGTQWRAGARFGPRAIREASTLFSFSHAGAYDHEDDATYLDGARILDIGDADIIHTDTERSHANIEAGVRAILTAGALPVVLGGDHSINIPCINAFSDQAPLHLVQIDAHLDFVDERHGVRFGHGNPMRRAAEKPWVTGLTQIGIRNVSSTAKDGYDAARAMGSDILSVRRFRKLGVEEVLERIPAGARYYLSIDIDGFDPSIAPGTGTPSHGGFLYYEGLELIAGLAKRGTIVGIDLVEVAPDHDHSGVTAILAAQLLLNAIGRILAARGPVAPQRMAVPAARPDAPPANATTAPVASALEAQGSAAATGLDAVAVGIFAPDAGPLAVLTRVETGPVAEPILEVAGYGASSRLDMAVTERTEDMATATIDATSKAGEIAEAKGLSAAAGEAMLNALRAGGGTSAQFNHPDLGGMGQWSSGGMIQIGDMFNNDLKARVANLAGELSNLMASGQLEDAGQHGGTSSGSGQSGTGWPSELGRPSSTGSQNDMSYAVFPETNRLAVKTGGKTKVYDTGDHRIGGVSQSQSGNQSLTFSSQNGQVRLEDLKLVDG